MTWAFDVRQRRRQPEIMDQPGLDSQQHAAALRGLARINYFSRSSAILWPAIAALAREIPDRPIELLDVATGGGDIPVALLHRAERTGTPVRMNACDISETALEFATARAAKSGARVNFHPWDVLAGPAPRQYDAVFCSLFLHHLDPDDAVVVLRRMADASRHLVLVNDLNRSGAGWLLAWAGTRVLTTSRVAHTDGPRSVEGAFTPAEARELAERAGLIGATVKHTWPCRWLLAWRRSG